ncbi:MAG: hypothetical protein WCQ47_07895, partial [bacterium]
EKKHKGFNPVLELIEISKGACDLDLRVNILKELIPYLYPKRKAIEEEIANNDLTFPKLVIVPGKPIYKDTNHKILDEKEAKKYKTVDISSYQQHPENNL